MKNATVDCMWEHFLRHSVMCRQFELYFACKGLFKNPVFLDYSVLALVDYTSKNGGLIGTTLEYGYPFTLLGSDNVTDNKGG